jgi:prophage regulatory protein
MRDKDSKPKNRLIGSAELRQLVPFSDAHFWRLERAGEFPRRIKLGGQRVGWYLAEVLAWIEARKAERDSDGQGPVVA